MKKLLERNEESLILDQNYRDFLANAKARLKTAQIRASIASNSELIQYYWELGTDLIEKQKTFKWGENFLKQFSHDMRAANPAMHGLSVRNLYRMKKFAELYPNPQILPHPVAKLPWGHISTLIHTVKDNLVRNWYAQQTLKNGWSRAVMAMQVESG